MKNNIVIMNFSGVYEVQGLKAVLEAGKTIIILFPSWTARTFRGLTAIVIAWQRKRSERELSHLVRKDCIFRLRQLPLSDKTVAGIGKGTF